MKRISICADRSKQIRKNPFKQIKKIPKSICYGNIYIKFEKGIFFLNSADLSLIVKCNCIL